MLLKKAQVESEDDPSELLDEATDKFRRASESQSDISEAFFGWGRALSEKTRLSSGDEAEKFSDEVQDKIKEALCIRNEEIEGQS